MYKYKHIILYIFNSSLIFMSLFKHIIMFELDSFTNQV